MSADDQLRSTRAVGVHAISQKVQHASTFYDGLWLFSTGKTYPNRADFSGVAAVGILFLSLEQE